MFQKLAVATKPCMSHHDPSPASCIPRLLAPPLSGLSASHCPHPYIPRTVCCLCHPYVRLLLMIHHASNLSETQRMPTGDRSSLSNRVRVDTHRHIAPPHDTSLSMRRHGRPCRSLGTSGARRPAARSYQPRITCLQTLCSDLRLGGL